MHSLLEDYLTELSARLGLLPAKRRNEELTEMRAHLERAFAAYRELGESEADAAQSALMQFRTVEKLEESIIVSWRRGEMLRKCDFWGAAICIFAVATVLDHLLDSTVLPFSSMEAISVS